MGQNSIPRIMIVESFGSNIKSLSNHLAALDIPLELLQATDADTAMTLLRQESPDLLIIDTCLRGKMDGFHLCRTLRSSELGAHIPIILLLSGYLSLERMKGIVAGADLLLHRPVVKEELLKMIQLLLASKLGQGGNGGSRQAPSENHSVRKLRPVSAVGD